MAYRAPVGEMRFLLDAVLGAGRLAGTDRFAEATSETVEAVLAEAARLAEDVLAPLRRAGDLTPARLENGVVRTTPGLRGGLPRRRRRRLGRHRRPDRARRDGAADDARDLRQRDVRRRKPRALALPAAEPGPDRGARAARLRGDPRALPAEARRRHLDRHDEPDRAASRLRRRRRPRPRRGQGRRHLRGQRAEDLHLVGRPRSRRERLPPRPRPPARRRARDQGPLALPRPEVPPRRRRQPRACATPSARSRSSTSSASTAARPA